MNVPEDLLYTQDHEWVRIENDIATVGITDYAQGELGEIVYVEIESDGHLEKGEIFGSVEAVKTVSDLFMPVSGTIEEINPDLEDEPEIVNNSPYKSGWMIRIRLSAPSEIEDLLDAESYKAEIA